MKRKPVHIRSFAWMKSRYVNIVLTAMLRFTLAVGVLGYASASPLVHYPFSQPVFQNIDDEEQIINGVVTSGLVSQNGVLWLTTQSGLVEYDGYHFSRYKHKKDDLNSLPGMYIFSIAEQHSGLIWLATRSNGLASLNPKNGKITRINTTTLPAKLSSDSLRSVFVDSQQAVWVGHDKGVNKLDPTGKTSQQYPLPHNLKGVTYSIFEPSPNVIWISGTYGIVEIKNNIAQPIEAVAHLNVRDIIADKQGNYWISTHRGMWIWDGKTRVIAPKNIPPAAQKSYFRNAVLADDGTIWASNYGKGIWLFDADSQTFLRQFVHDPSNISSLTFNDLGKIIKGPDNSLWVGSWGGGLQRLDLNSTGHFAHIRHSLMTDIGLSNGNIRAVATLDNGHWVFGSKNGGIDVFDPSKGKIAHISHTSTGEELTSVISLTQDSNGRVWAGTHAQGLMQLDIPNNVAVAQNIEGLQSVSLFRLLAMRDGRIAVGANRGACVIDADLTRCDFINKPDNQPLLDSITNLYEDKFGNLWVACHLGLFRLKPSATLFEQFSAHNSNISNNYVLGMITNKKDGLYVITSTGFDEILDANADTPQFLDRQHTMNLGAAKPGGNALVDKSGRLWSGATILEFDKRKLHQYGADEGADIGTAWLGSFAQSHNNTMLFGGTRGVLVVEPNGYEAPVHNSKIVIRKWLQGGKTVTVPTNTVPILESNGRAFSAQIAAIDLVYAKHITYEYRLDGLDTEWQTLDENSRWISFTNLTPGRYQLEVRAKYNVVSGNIAPLTLPIRVMPAFWQTQWFKLLVALSIILLISALFKWRIDIVKARAKYLETLVGQRTQELAAINKIGRQFTSHLTLDEVFHDIYEHMAGIACADTFGIGLIDSDREHLIFEFATEQGVRFDTYKRSLDNRGQLAVHCAIKNQSILISNYDQQFDLYHPNPDSAKHTLSNGQTGAQAVSMIYVPMSIQKQVIGVIGMQSFRENSYSKNDITILETLASYAAIALANAKSHQNLIEVHDQLKVSVDQLKATQEKLVMQEKMASLGHLVAGVAHQVNTPLGISMTALSTLDESFKALEDDFNNNQLKRQTLEGFIDRYQQAHALMTPNLHKTAELIQQFKQVAASSNDTQVSHINLPELCNQVIAVAATQAKSQNVTLCLDTQTPQVIYANTNSLNQVLLILINNALQHAFKSQSNKEIRLSYYISDQRLIIRCQDNGQGISPERIDKIFDPFFTTSIENGAIGLGLSIAYNIVHQHFNGTIKCFSELNRGTLVEVTLPTDTLLQKPAS
ncbi:hypothetical protein BGP78_01710 [Pseudoalteromonas sp. MSK9-3]|uniref:ATP-binding protein n=1 Tax=Pseudoalteromonas sp. MSK9-3 TaxID=1897633 RepID=UPI000E6B8BC7|nr:ATP-binding protein [Pseudoalteromonas sp. MSK9-3]RJE76988.1 hypothetical protein BGP78_01710 [Pseudoalteromonas sp. MSK9-3]